MKRLITTILVSLLAAMSLTSCIKEEDYLVDSSARLHFSVDTVSFDTVFATMATVTQAVKVYNTYDEPMLIDAVTLLHGTSSRFRINVDGDTGFVARNVEIASHDSIFIFVQANINPNDQTSPYIVTDSIVFSFNRKQQCPYSQRQYMRQGSPYYKRTIIDCANWDHTRPHVIIGYAVVNSNETLHLNAGEELYFGAGACLWVYDSATIDVRGSQTAPVIFSSVRHDSYYDSLPGQWQGIWLSAGSKDNYLEWARIENAVTGIQVDTNVNSNPTLEIRNCVIQNHSMIGILGQGAYIVGDNLLVACCGQSLMDLRYGGRYRFYNSSLANYWRYDSRKTPSLVLSNYYAYTTSTIFPRPLQEADFRNCIVYGNFNGRDNSGEIMFDRIDNADFNVTFRNCLLRTTLVTDGVNGNIVGRDPKFKDAYKHDFTPLKYSPAANAGEGAYITIPYDLNGNPRGNPPTIGAFEAENK